MGRLVGLTAHIPLIINQVMVIYDDCRKILCQLILKLGIVCIATCRCRKRVSSDINDVDGTCLRKVQQRSLIINHVERDVELL